MIFKTFTGAELDLENLDPQDIRIADVAHSLAWQCRYNGHLHTWYSVAQHCVAMKKYAERFYPEADYLDFACLIHDAPEYISGDNPTPWKAICPQGREWEKELLPVIAKVKFKIPNWESLEARVSFLDKDITMTEMALFLDRTVDISEIDSNWAECIGPPLERDQAEMEYIKHYAQLYEKYHIEEDYED